MYKKIGIYHSYAYSGNGYAVGNRVDIIEISIHGNGNRSTVQFQSLYREFCSQDRLCQSILNICHDMQHIVTSITFLSLLNHILIFWTDLYEL